MTKKPCDHSPRNFRVWRADLKRIKPVIEAAKRISVEYEKRALRELGTTGEIAEFEAARLLNLRLCPPGTRGHDAFDKDGFRISIKGKVDAGKNARMGRIGMHNWDKVALIILNKQYQPKAIYIARRPKVERLLKGKTRRDLMLSAFRKCAGLPFWP